MGQRHGGVPARAGGRGPGHARLFTRTAPYQRGSTESRNGRIRRYLPKGTSFEDLTQDELDAIVKEINAPPPIKLLGYKTPNEVWDDEISKLQSKATNTKTDVALTK